jgi:DNA-binding transcriptional MerR regulator
MADRPSDEMTIDELAQRARLPSSTVRLYQSRGLLPPPRRAGRVGYYSGGHLARLRLIAELQRRGFSLAAIQQLVDAWESGRSLDDLLGLEAEVTSPGSRPEPVRMNVEELAQRLAGQPVGPELLRRVVDLGLVSLEPDGMLAADPRFLAFGAELTALGIPAGEIIDEWEALRDSAGQVAVRFVGVFERYLWRPFAEAGMPPERLPALTAALRRLGPLAEEVVVAALRIALERAASAFVAEQARALDTAGLLEQVRRDLGPAGEPAPKPERAAAGRPRGRSRPRR